MRDRNEIFGNFILEKKCSIRKKKDIESRKKDKY